MFLNSNFKPQSCWKKMFKENTLVFFCLSLRHLVVVFGDTHTETSVSVMEGDSVTLQIHVTEIQTGDEIQWTFGANRSLIAETNGKTSKIHDGPDDRFRDRLKLDQTGSLTITNITTTDSGLYEVEISRSRSEEKHRFSVTVYAAPTTARPSTPTSHSSSGAHSGSAAGHTKGPPDLLIVLVSAAGSLLLLVAVGIFWICRKHRKTDQHAETHEEEITYSDPTFYKRNAQKSTAKQEDDVVYASVVHRR